MPSWKSTAYELVRFLYYPSWMQNMVRRDRFLRLLHAAKRNSPFYSERLSGIRVRSLKDIGKLPVLTKREMMREFDRIVTDRDVNLQKVQNHIQAGCKDKLLMNRYMAACTSGSTNTPATVLYDPKSFQILELSSVIRAGVDAYPHVTILSDRTFSLGCTSVALGGESDRYFFIDSNLTNEAIVKKLNELKPKIIQTYPSVLFMLCTEKRNGNLRIQPKKFLVSGELLNEELRSLAEECFGCKVYSLYAGTETGYIAVDCECGHLHLFNDWLEIEPVDKDNRPTPPGDFSDKILITNFSNHVQPLIRYEMNDRVRIHTELCACGCKRPWLEVRGRAFDSLRFMREDKLTVVPYFRFSSFLQQLPEVILFQVIQHTHTQIECRIKLKPKAEAAKAFDAIRIFFSELLVENAVDGVDISVNSDPFVVENSGKVRLSICLCKDQS